MIRAVTAGGAQVSIVVKHITSVMETSKGRIEVTLVGGETLTIVVDYAEFVSEVAKMV